MTTSYTPNFLLAKPVVNGPETENTWGFDLNANADIIDGQMAPIMSPNFAGLPKAITASVGTSTEQLATTRFVAQAVSGMTGGVGIAEAPNDGWVYGRQSLGWTPIERRLKLLRPQSFGAVPDNPDPIVAQNNVTAFQAMIAEMQARGGYSEIVIDDTYYVYPTNGVGGVSPIFMLFDSVRHVNVYYESGGGFASNADFAAPGVYAPYFYFMRGDCREIHFYNPKHHASVQRGQGIGLQHFVVNGTAKEIHIHDCDLLGGSIGLSVDKGVGYYQSHDRAKYFSLTGVMDTVQDPLRFIDNGDYSVANVRVNNSGRSFAIANCHHHRWNIDSSNPALASKISCAPNATQNIEENSTQHIDIFYRERWDVAGLNGDATAPELVTIAFQPDDEGSNGTPGYIRDIKLKFEVDHTAGAELPRIMSMVKIVGGIGGGDTTVRGYVLNNFEISGTILGLNGSYSAFELFPTGGTGGDWRGEDTRNFRLQDLIIQGTPGVDGGAVGPADIVIGANPVLSGLTLKNVNSQGLLRLGTTVLGTLDISQNVEFPNVRSASNNAFTVGTHGEVHHRYLPNGELEMMGFSNCAESATTTITLPKPLRTAHGMVYVTARSAYAVDIRATVVSTTTISISRGSGTGPVLVQWMVRGHTP